jgi:hypothetical protein
MKLIQELLAVCESTLLEEKLSLAELVAKHKLTLKPSGKAIEDFAFTDAIGKEFAENGFELNYNNKKNHFDITTDKQAQDFAKKQEMIDARKSSGFNAAGTRRTSANVGGGHSVNGIKK